MQVTDTDGYIMRTVVNFQPHENLISISPLDSYEEERYYLLKISNKVCSMKGTALKTNVNILFKLYKGKMKNHQTVRQDVPIPESLPRPDDYDEWQNERTPNDLDNYVDNYPKRMKMETDNVAFRPWLGVLGLIAVVIGILSMNIAIIAVSLLVCIVGAVHIYLQWRNPRFRSKMLYNKGVKHFNQLQYQLAKEYFEASLEINPKNDLAKYAMARVGLYKL
jgi:tetratricopeptide (TPR) repeat protein